MREHRTPRCVGEAFGGTQYERRIDDGASVAGSSRRGSALGACLGGSPTQRAAGWCPVRAWTSLRGFDPPAVHCWLVGILAYFVVP
jgi:hypothetical protein